MPAHIGILEYCQTQCGEVLNSPHIYTCQKLNQPGQECDIEKMHNGFIREMKHHLKVWEDNIAKLNEVPSGTSRDTAVPVIVKIT